MPSVLTIDDSRAVRMLVSKNAREMGLEVEEAEDGKQGLEKLETQKFDLIVLDVTMPEMDGPTMLAQLRERGDTTPVLMLTSESKRSIVASLMKLNIEGYILKPFKPDELKAKIAKALKVDGAPAADPALAREMAAVIQAPTAAEQKSGESGKQFIDILCVDDMENVAKRLRTMIPEHITLNNATSAQAALTICRERVFRVLLIDNDMPDVDSSSLMHQLKVMQPGAAFLTLSLRSNGKAQADARDAGFASVVFKPFDAESIEEFLQRYFDSQDIVAKVDNLVTVSAFKGRQTRLPGYFIQVTTGLSKALEEIAAACFAESIIDISALPPVPEQTARLVLQLTEQCSKIGVELRLVGGAEIGKTLKQLVETADLPVFATVSEARGDAAAS